MHFHGFATLITHQTSPSIHSYPAVMLREGAGEHQISSRPLSAVGDSARIAFVLLYSPQNHALFNARLLRSFLIMRRNFAEGRNQPFQQHENA
jgi:hypothetical protein